MSRWTKLTVLSLCSTLAWSCADSLLAPDSAELAKGGPLVTILPGSDGMRQGKFA